MNIAEVKLDLFRRIDSLNESELEKVYNKFLSLLNSCSYQLTNQENKAIDEALNARKIDRIYTHEEVVAEANCKYPNLKFK